MLSDQIMEVLETYSPVPRYATEALNLLLSRYLDSKSYIEELLGRKEYLVVLSNILGYSQYLRNSVLEDFGLLKWLLENYEKKFDIHSFREQITSFLSENDKNEFLRGLKKLRKREFFRIVLQEIIGLIGFEESLERLSLIADAVIEAVLDFNYKELTKRYGVPSSEFSVLSLGKLGGMEINYSSDVDLMFVYGDDGKTDKGYENSEFFDKLARELIYDLSSSVGGEFIYRVDTRLRPDGEFGALVRKEESYYNYYTERAQAWEIQMLIRARFSAGGEKLGRRFIDNLKKIVFSTTPTDTQIAEILGIKQKIKGSENDLKKSTGGIRDIEFIIQLLQLIFGTKEDSLRVSNTLLALERLENLKVIDKDTRRVLDEAYRTFRRLENYIQLYANLQDFSLPTSNKERMIGLYRLLHSSREKVRGDEDVELLKTVKRMKSEVIKVKGYIFEKLLDVKMGEEGIFILYNSEESEVKELLSSFGLKDTTRAFSFLESMIASSFRGGVETSIGFRNLLRAISRSPLPDRSLSNIYYILEATQNLPISIQFFTDERNINFIYNVSLLKDVFINILRKRNWIWDGMMDTNAFIDYITQVFINKISFSDSRYRDTVREVWEVFITGLGFLRINRFIDALRTKEILSSLYDKIFYELSARLDGEVCILSLGRLANRKITFFSDVDVVYILPYHSHSDKFYEIRDLLLKFHNDLNTVFEIDTRLVEGAHKGSFILSLNTLKDTEFDIWKTIAYLKSRPICANEKLSEEVREVILEKLKKSIRSIEMQSLNSYIHKVIRTFQNINDLKKGRGNLLEIELILDKLYIQNHMSFQEIPIAKPLSYLANLLENTVKINVPIKDYLSYLVEVEDVIRVVEGIGFDDRFFDIVKLPITFEEFVRLRNDVISWCDAVLND
ncbi:MAG: hypothetical protein RMJ37_06885 [Spirochaetia bacterium]|nr:hypothetical protein [Spirochaetota bacterium]MCX8095984.1 hypothetical protein [Spirochaetota bacterium]MDW8113039.1 hypothetical protein [Spirochaetia bacterium]